MSFTNSFMADEVKILEVAKVSPFLSSITINFSLPLSFFDVMWFKVAPPDSVYFYPIPDLKSNAFNSLILPKLKKSLSQALLHFFHVAGNLIWHPSREGPVEPIFRYTSGDGVFLTVAESTNINTHHFNCLSSDEPYEAIGLHPLIPPLVSSDDAAALLALQITLFPNQGFCIGITSHHAIFDAKSVTIFMNNWAYLCKSSQGDNQDENSLPSLPVELTPVFDRSIIKDPIRLDKLYLDQWIQHSPSKSLKISQDLGVLPPDFVRATFRLTRDDIKKLREMVVSKWDRSQTSPIPRLSTFVLTLAYVSTCKVKARGGEKHRKVSCSFLINYRNRLNPPAPENYFGNCVGSSGLLSAKAVEFMDEENGLVFSAKLLSDAIRGADTFEMDWEVQKEYIYEFVNYSKRQLEGQIICVSASPLFNFYGADFGWGRPKKVLIASIDRSDAVSFLESGDGSGGIEIGLASEKEEMERFSSFFNAGLEKWRHRRSAL